MVLEVRRLSGVRCSRVCLSFLPCTHSARGEHCKTALSPARCVDHYWAVVSGSSCRRAVLLLLENPEDQRKTWCVTCANIVSTVRKVCRSRPDPGKAAAVERVAVVGMGMGRQDLFTWDTVLAGIITSAFSFFIYICTYLFIYIYEGRQLKGRIKKKSLISTPTKQLFYYYFIVLKTISSDMIKLRKCVTIGKKTMYV